MEPPRSRAVALTFVPSKSLITLGQRVEGHPAGSPDEPWITLAAKHGTKSPGLGIGSEAARSAKLVVDLLIPARTKSASSVPISRLSPNVNIRGYGLHSSLAVQTAMNRSTTESIG